MGSGFGVGLVVLGGFVTAISFSLLTTAGYSGCLTAFWNNPGCLAYSGRYSFSPGMGVLGFYLGILVAVIGAIAAGGPDVVKLFRKLGASPDSEQ